MDAANVAVVERSVEDVLAGRLRIRLAGTWYILPVLTRGQNRDWLASLDAGLAPILAAEDDLEKVIATVQEYDDGLLDLIWSYDVTHVLPPQKQIADDIYPHEALKAVMEVRLAANPTLAYGLAEITEQARNATEQRQIVAAAMSNLPSPKPSSPRRHGAGRSAKSTN